MLILCISEILSTLTMDVGNLIICLINWQRIELICRLRREVIDILQIIAIMMTILALLKGLTGRRLHIDTYIHIYTYFKYVES